MDDLPANEPQARTAQTLGPQAGDSCNIVLSLEVRQFVSKGQCGGYVVRIVRPIETLVLYLIDFMVKEETTL